MKKLLVLIISTNMLLAVTCDENIKHFGYGDDHYYGQQEIQLNCVDGYRFRVLTELPQNKILEIEDNKYLNKGKVNEDKKN